MDRVQVVKRETAELGGDGADERPWPEPIDPQEDAIEVAGIYLQDSSNRDETALISRSGDDITFKDGSNPSGFTLTELAAGGSGGISESEHEALDTLAHEIDETSYDEVTYSGSNVSSYIVWETSSKLKKIREELYSYTSGKVTQVITKQYDGTGTLKMTMTEDYTYSGSKVSTVTRTKS